jgi:hypothetical protein
MLFTPKAFAEWNKLMTEIKAQKKSVVSISDLKNCRKTIRYSLSNLYLLSITKISQNYLNSIKKICSKICLLRRLAV